MKNKKILLEELQYKLSLLNYDDLIDINNLVDSLYLLYGRKEHFKCM